MDIFWNSMYLHDHIEVYSVMIVQEITKESENIPCVEKSDFPTIIKCSKSLSSFHLLCKLLDKYSHFSKK